MEECDRETDMPMMILSCSINSNPVVQIHIIDKSDIIVSRKKNWTETDWSAA